MVECYPYEDLGYVIDPESDMKEITVILIGKQMAKCNPRPYVIYITGEEINENYEKLEELKEYCETNKIVFICPKGDNLEAIEASYSYAVKNCKNLNIRPNDISVRYDVKFEDLANEFVEYLSDEYDIETEDAKLFHL